MKIAGKELVGGVGAGELLHAGVGLSFWGGVDPIDGKIIDHTHPLHKHCITDKILAIPNGRGSCTGSQVMLELVLNDTAPAAILLRQPDMILALGVIVAEELFGKSIPIVSLGAEGFDAVASAKYVAVHGAEVRAADSADELCTDAAGKWQGAPEPSSPDVLLAASSLTLSPAETALLDGDGGRGSQVAMRIMARAASVQGAAELLEVTQAHIDACTYIGPGGLKFAQTLAELGAKVAVPTTLNSGSVDRQKWKALGVSAALGDPASALGDAYLALGAKYSFTCAPYLLDSAPSLGDQVAWGESNAVVFANSVLGARTQKYADYLDICAAIVARVPAAGPHLDSERIATVEIDATAVAAALSDECADAFWPALGYLVGLKSESRVPVVVGLEASAPSLDDLKAFSAAFGTSAAVALYHIAGVTPEAPDATTALDNKPAEETMVLTQSDFRMAWRLLDSAGGSDAGKKATDDIELVAVGNPHLSLTECAKLAELVADGAPKHPDVSMVATMGREVMAQAEAAGHKAAMEGFGIEFVSDTCWCMLTEPIVPISSKTLITNSAKYAHYAPGLVNRLVRFDSMAGCVEAARTGRARPAPKWLAQTSQMSTSARWSSVAASAFRIGRAVLRR